MKRRYPLLSFFLFIPLLCSAAADRAQQRLSRLSGHLAAGVPQAAKKNPVHASAMALEDETQRRGILFTWGHFLDEHKDIFEKLLYNEARFYKDYFVCYTAFSSELRFLQHVFCRIFEARENKNLRDDFIFFREPFNNSRFTAATDFSTVQEFLAHYNQIHNYHPGLPEVLLSANLTIFGNFAHAGSSTIGYFSRVGGAKYMTTRDAIFSTLQYIKKNYHLKGNLAQDFEKIIKNYKPNLEDLVQIFIPKKIVDNVAYLSGDYGRKIMNPLHRNKKIVPGYDAQKRYYTKISPLLQQLQEDVMAHKEGINNHALQLRIFLSKEGPFSDPYLYPEHPVRMFRFTGLSQQQLVDYYDAVDAVLQKSGLPGAYKSHEAYPITVAESALPPVDQKLFKRGVQKMAPVRMQEVYLSRGLEDEDRIIDQIKNLMKNPDFDKNEKNKQGRTVLHKAVDSGDEKVIQFLLANGVDLDVLDNKGMTAMDIAIQDKRQDIVGILKDAQRKEKEQKRPGRLKSKL